MINSGCIEKHIGAFNQQAEDSLLALLVHRHASVQKPAKLTLEANGLVEINQILDPGGALPIHSDGLRLQCLSQGKFLGIAAGKGGLEFSCHPLAQWLRCVYTDTRGMR